MTDGTTWNISRRLISKQQKKRISDRISNFKVDCLKGYSNKLRHNSISSEISISNGVMLEIHYESQIAVITGEFERQTSYI